MKIGLATTFGDTPYRDIAFLKDYAVATEALGYHSLWAPEHIVFFPKYESDYPYESEGKVPWKNKGGLYDPLLVLAVASQVTTRLRFGTTVLVVPERPALLTAKEVMTLDHITGGRLEFGAGLGWSAEEYGALGVSWEDRGARFDEYLDVIKLVWRQSPADFDGKFVKFKNVMVEPLPLTPGGPPILIGGNSKPALRRAVRIGDGWYGVWKGEMELEPVLNQLLEYLEAAGRHRDDGFRIKVNVPLTADLPPDEVARKLEEAERLGLHELVLGLPIRSRHFDHDMRFWADLTGIEKRPVSETA
ncbi:MAG: LLM class F420-dependent oxidoreductase [Sphingomonadales bacterium]